MDTKDIVKISVLCIKMFLMFVLFQIGYYWKSRTDLEYDKYLSDVVLRYYTKEEIAKDNIRVYTTKPTIKFTNGFVPPQWETDNFLVWKGYPYNTYRGALLIFVFIIVDKGMCYVYTLIKENNIHKKKGKKKKNHYKSV